MKLIVSDIQRFCMHDGPGIRTVVFLKGCPLRCAWCHNPEMQSVKPELLFYNKKCIGCGICKKVCPNGGHAFGETNGHTVDRTLCVTCGKCADACPTGALEVSGRSQTIVELMAEIGRDRAFYGKDGGLTISGGEPFMQPEGSAALLRACKDAGMTTVVETCGQFDPEIIPEIVTLVDLFLFDVKDTDSARHKKYTGVGNELILSNLRKIDSLGGRTRLRCIIVNTVNNDEKHISMLNELRVSLRNCEGIEYLPYHAYGGAKAEFIGRQDNGRNDWIPDSVPENSI